MLFVTLKLNNVSEQQAGGGGVAEQAAQHFGDLGLVVHADESWTNVRFLQGGIHPLSTLTPAFSGDKRDR
jgi:hypothetical protein